MYSVSSISMLSDLSVNSNCHLDKISTQAVYEFMAGRQRKVVPLEFAIIDPFINYGDFYQSFIISQLARL